MQVIQTRNTIDVAVEQGRNAIRLAGGVPYVMHDVEVASGRDAGAFTDVQTLPPVPTWYEPTATAGRLVVPFIGGLGDAISLLPVFAMVRRSPGTTGIDVATTPGPAEIFTLSPAVDHVRPYALTLDEWRRYDTFLTLEAVIRTGQSPGRPLPEVFAAALGLEDPGPVFELKIPGEATRRPRHDDGPPLVAIAVGEHGSTRSYPHHATIELVKRLASSGIACILLGHEDPSRPVREHPPFVTDMRGRTPNILELAVWLREMDAVVAVDSLIMHLAGALGRQTVGLFTATSAAHAAPYRSADVLASGAECAPCHAVGSACPKGLDRCIAWDDAAVTPDAVVAAVHDVLGRRGPRHRASEPRSSVTSAA